MALVAMPGENRPNLGLEKFDPFGFFCCRRFIGSSRARAKDERDDAGLEEATTQPAS